MSAPIICFMGLDGSGKSTSIEHAYAELSSRGVRVEVVRAAYVVKVLNKVIKLGKKIVLNKQSNPYSGNYKEYLESMRKRGNSGPVYKVFSMLTTLEFKCQILWHIRLKHLSGITLLVDRYIYDNAVTYAANLGKGEDFLMATIDCKWKSAPKPNKLIYIKTPVEVCCSRKDDIPDPLYLEVRKPLYEKISEMYGAKVIAGDQPLEGMLTEVMGEIDPLIEKAQVR